MQSVELRIPPLPLASASFRVLGAQPAIRGTAQATTAACSYPYQGPTLPLHGPASCHRCYRLVSCLLSGQAWPVKVGQLMHPGFGLIRASLGAPLSTLVQLTHVLSPACTHVFACACAHIQAHTRADIHAHAGKVLVLCVLCLQEVWGTAQKEAVKMHRVPWLCGRPSLELGQAWRGQGAVVVRQRQQQEGRASPLRQEGWPRGGRQEAGAAVVNAAAARQASAAAGAAQLAEAWVQGHRTAAAARRPACSLRRAPCTACRAAPHAGAWLATAWPAPRRCSSCWNSLQQSLVRALAWVAIAWVAVAY